jgi:hypothetical protein
MSITSSLSRSDVTLIGGAVIIIVFAIVITAAVQASNESSFSQILTVGPVWRGDTWLCTSTAEFLVHGALVSYNDGAGLTINVSGQGTQPDIRLSQNEMKTFSLGGPADSSIRITRSLGTISGFLTLQTTSDAVASCQQL